MVSIAVGFIFCETPLNFIVANPEFESERQFALEYNLISACIVLSNLNFLIGFSTLFVLLERGFVYTLCFSI